MGRAGVATCLWCGTEFEVPVRPGPAPKYCRPSHRQRAYEARTASATSVEDSSKDDPRARESSQPATIQAASRGRVFIQLLGPVEVLRENGRPFSLGPVLRRVVATLAQQPRRVVGVQRLIDSIWPGVDDRVARHRLSTAIWQLRTILGSTNTDGDQGFISWKSPGYMLNAGDHQLDWARFKRLQTAGEDTLHSSEPGLAKSYLSAALRLWTGQEPLMGVEITTDDQTLVADLTASRQQAESSLTTAYFDLGRYVDVVSRLTPVVENDPLDESAVMQLSMAQQRLGHPAVALSTLDRHIEFATMAGWEASSAITDLQTAILRREPLPGHPARAGRGLVPAPDHSVFMAISSRDTSGSLVHPLPGEQSLILQARGGKILSVSDGWVEASFADLTTALDAAAALEERLPRSLTQAGLIVTESVSNPFDGPPRVRARYLAEAANAGQVLVAGPSRREVEQVVADSARIRGVGYHRLAPLAASAQVFLVAATDLAGSLEEPTWRFEGTLRNMPDDPFRLVGRHREVVEATEGLSVSRLVTLVGAPGSGKTRLAAHVAKGLSNEYQDGAWFIDLTPLSQPEAVVEAIADALSIPVGGEPDAWGALAKALEPRRTLLILDSCEHLLEPCREVVSRLMTSCPDISVLATSRQRLGIRVEKVVTIHPFDPPVTETHEELVDNPAVRLFYERFKPATMGKGPAPETNDAELSQVARICRAVDGLPLGLVLAAAKAQQLGPGGLADMLDEHQGDGLFSPTTGPPASEHDRETLNGTLDWSYRLLKTEERTVFAALSVFKASFTIDDALAVCGNGVLPSATVAASLQHLERASLLTAVAQASGHNRFRMLQPIREYAAVKLAALTDVVETVHRHHAEHFLAIAEDTEPELRGPQNPAVLARLETSLPDLRSSIQWALSSGDSTRALRLVGALWLFWYVRGLVVEGKTLTESALDLDRSISQERVKALSACGHLSWLSGHLKKCWQTGREALHVVEAIGGDWEWAWTQLALAGVGVFDVKDESVPLRLVEAIQQFRRLGNDWETAFAIEVLGNAAFQRGDYERAEKALSESLAMFWAIGTPTMQASVLAHGLMLALLGHLEEGAREVDEAIESAYETGELVHLAWALCHRAAISRYGGHHHESRHRYQDALRIANEAGNLWAMVWALSGIGNTQELGLPPAGPRVEEAVRLLAKAREMMNTTGLGLAPREREYLAADLKTAGRLLDERTLTAAMARGEGMKTEEAVDLALHLDQRASVTSD